MAEVEAEAGAESGEEEFTSADVEVAWMLLGSVSFVMSLLYLVNWYDDDIRFYTWKIISTTLSIFLAVLLFTSFNELLLKRIESLGPVTVCVMQLLHCLAYVLAMQVSIAMLSGAILEQHYVDLDQEKWVINDPMTKEHGMIIEEHHVRNKDNKRSVMLDHYGMEVPVQKQKHELESRLKNVKCYARLLSHMAGFAAINAGATLQQLGIFRQSPLHALLPVVITQVLILIVFFILGEVRKTHHQEQQREGRAGRRARLYHEEVFEAENDISSLSMSFLTVNVVRFTITGVLPNVEGDEQPPIAHDLQQVLTLLGTGFLFAVVACVLVFVKSQRGRADQESLGQRLLLICLNAVTMCFAWCALWAAVWFFAEQSSFPRTSVMGRVIIALVLSFVSCVAVFGLDFVDDRSKEDETQGNETIQVLVNSLGILIGFSWEHCFDAGLPAVASRSRKPELVKFMLGLAIAAVMTPMWRRHILAKEMHLTKLKEDRKEARREGLAPAKPMQLMPVDPREAHPHMEVHREGPAAKPMQFMPLEAREIQPLVAPAANNSSFMVPESTFLRSGLVARAPNAVAGQRM